MTEDTAELVKASKALLDWFAVPNQSHEAKQKRELRRLLEALQAATVRVK